MVGVSGLLGATYTPHCAALDPARLVRGLADAVEGLGGSIYEGTRGLSRSDPRSVDAGNGADERRLCASRGCRQGSGGLDGLIPGQERALLPVYSLMIATEPLPDTFWAGAGLANRRDLFRPSAPDHLWPTHGGREVGLRRAGCAVPLWLGRSVPHTTGHRRCTGRLRAAL